MCDTFSKAKCNFFLIVKGCTMFRVYKKYVKRLRCFPQTLNKKHIDMCMDSLKSRLQISSALLWDLKENRVIQLTHHLNS